MLRWWGWRRIVSVAVGVPALGLAAYLLLKPPPTPVEATLQHASTSIEPTGVGSSTTSVDADSPAPTSLSVVTVHVAGRVLHPDVYSLPSGSRAVDAVAAAGGAAMFADMNAVNLATVLMDGQQVYIPAIGEAPRTASATSPSPGSSAPFEPVNINTADESALDALPGIGPSTARAIVAYRDEHGPFATVESLDQVPGIGPSKVANLDGLVTT